MIQNIHFTDPQGMVHTAATFKIRRADKHESSSSFMSLSSADFTTYDAQESTPGSFVSFSLYYWASEAARLAQAAPYILANTENMTMEFTFNTDATYDGLDLEAIVVKRLTDVILPPMLVV